MSGASRSEPCPLDEALELLGRKWMLAIIRELLSGPRRFAELHVATGCPSPSTLVQRLRVLEAESMLARRGTSRGGRVEYRLTPKGAGLGRALIELGEWAERWLTPRAASADFLEAAP